MVTPLPPGPWNLQAFRGEEAERMEKIKERTVILAKSQGSRFPAMPCVAPGCNVSNSNRVPSPQKAHGSATHVTGFHA